MTALPPCNTCCGIEYHWARYTHARFVAGAFPIFEDFSMDEARRFYRAHAADPRWVPDEFDQDAMRHLGVRVPRVDGPGPGSTPDARRVAGQTHDGHTCDASRQAAADEAHRMVAPLFNVGDRVRVAGEPLITSPAGELVSHLYAKTLAGVEGRVMYGPDLDGDYKIAPDSGALDDVWVHGSCLTKIEEVEA